MQKKGKDRLRPWLIGLLIFFPLLAAGTGLFWFFNREPNPITLKYGELMQILQTPESSVRLHNVRADSMVFIV